VDVLSLITAFGIGLLGGAHCIGMCGGLIGALSVAIEPKQTTLRYLLIFSYNLGRIVSYVFIATVFYLLIHQIEHYFWLSFLRILAGVMLIAMGLYLAGWWKGLTYLEKVGGYFWKFIQPLSQKLLPIKTIHQAFLLGLVWGWLPCGLIYSALTYSFTASSALNAALIMLFFALGTLPAVVLSGLVADKLLSLIKKQGVRNLFALLVIAFGVWTLLIAFQHSAHAHSGHNHSMPNHKDHLTYQHH
jgi:sulfite exporter TauE/SafE